MNQANSGRAPFHGGASSFNTRKPAVDGWPLRDQALRRRPGRRLGRHLPRRARHPAGPWRATGACARRPPTTTGLRAPPLHRTDAERAGVRWGRRVHARRGWATGEYEIRAWVDRFGTWRDELRRKLEAGQTDLTGRTLRGRNCCCSTRSSARRSPGDSTDIAAIKRCTGDPATTIPRRSSATSCTSRVSRPPEAGRPATALGPLPVRVDRQRALFRRVV